MTNLDVENKGNLEGENSMKEGSNIIIPIGYDFVERLNENLIVATKGCINGLRYMNNPEKQKTENKRSYGFYFNKYLEKRELNLEVDFYTNNGKIHSDKKMLACIPCINNDMVILLDENYKWSISLIDYHNLSFIDIGFEDMDYIKMDYSNRRFIMSKDKKYSAVSFDKNSRILNLTPFLSMEIIDFSERGYITKEYQRYGFIDLWGNIILECGFDGIEPKEDFIEVNHYIYREEIFRKGAYSYSGEFLMPCNYISITSTDIFKNQTLYVGIRETKSGFRYCEIYSNKRKISSKPYPYMNVLPDGIIIFAMDAKYGILKYDCDNDSLYEILRCNFDQIKSVTVDNTRYFWIKKADRYALYDIEGNQVRKFRKKYSIPKEERCLYCFV